MTDAPSTSSYFTVENEVDDLPKSKQLVASSNFDLLDDGSTLQINVTGNFDGLSPILNGDGYVIYTGDQFITRSIQNSSSVSFTHPDGISGVNQPSFTRDSTVQLVNVDVDSLNLATRSKLNFLPQGAASITVADNSGQNRTNITISGPENLTPIDATYILQKPHPLLTQAQALSELETGILKNHTSTGEVSIAVPDVDYQSASQNLTQISGFAAHVGDLIVGAAAGGLDTIGSGAENYILSSDGTSIVWTDQGTGTVTSVGISSTDSTISVGGVGPNPIIGSGIINLDLPHTGVIPNVLTTYTNLTVDAYGRMTDLTSVTIPGTVSSVSATSPSSSVNIGGVPITSSGNIEVDMSIINIAPNSYQKPNVTVTSRGLITEAESTGFAWNVLNPANGNYYPGSPGQGYILLSETLGVPIHVFINSPGISNPVFNVGDRIILVNPATSGQEFRLLTASVFGAIPNTAPGGFGNAVVLPAGVSSSIECVCVNQPGSPTFQAIMEVINFSGNPSIILF